MPYGAFITFKNIKIMFKQEIANKLKAEALRDLKRRGHHIGQKVLFDGNKGYTITGVEFLDLTLKEIIIKIERGLNWHNVNYALGLIRPDLTEYNKAAKKLGIFRMVLTETIIKELKELWFIYGNNGKYHTKGNHRLIQEFLETYKLGSDVNEQYKKDKKFFSKKPSIGSTKPASIECIEQIEKLFE